MTLALSRDPSLFQPVPAHSGGGLCCTVHGAAQQDPHHPGAQRPSIHAPEHHATGTQLALAYMVQPYVSILSADKRFKIVY